LIGIGITLTNRQRAAIDRALLRQIIETLLGSFHNSDKLILAFPVAAPEMTRLNDISRHAATDVTFDYRFGVPPQAVRSITAQAVTHRLKAESTMHADPVCVDEAGSPPRTTWQSNSFATSYMACCIRRGHDDQRPAVRRK
jgi:hypothetical protein